MGWLTPSGTPKEPGQLPVQILRRCSPSLHSTCAVARLADASSVAARTRPSALAEAPARRGQHNGDEQCEPPATGHWQEPARGSLALDRGHLLDDNAENCAAEEVLRALRTTRDCRRWVLTQHLRDIDPRSGSARSSSHFSSEVGDESFRCDGSSTVASIVIAPKCPWQRGSVDLAPRLARFRPPP
jgi:hypothetical protein